MANIDTQISHEGELTGLLSGSEDCKGTLTLTSLRSTGSLLSCHPARTVLLISVLHAETSPPWLWLLLFFPFPSQALSTMADCPMYLLSIFTPQGMRAAWQGFIFYAQKLSLVFRAFQNTGTQKALISNLWNGQIREQIKEENNEWINL